MSDKKTTPYHKIVGITKKGNVVVLEETFEVSKSFTGAIGYIMRELTKVMIDEANSLANYREDWQNDVFYGNTELGLEDWIEDEKRQDEEMGRLCRGDDPTHRDEFKELVATLPKTQQQQIEALKSKDFVDWQCTDCGRIFNNDGKPDTLDADDELEVIFDPTLIDVVKEAEQNSDN